MNTSHAQGKNVIIFFSKIFHSEMSDITCFSNNDASVLFILSGEKDKYIW